MSRRSNNAFLWKVLSVVVATGVLFVFRNAFAGMIQAPTAVIALQSRVSNIEEKIGGIREIFQQSTNQINQRFDRVDHNQKDLQVRVDKIYEIINQRRPYAGKD